ncbi:MAG: hypothetical protein ACP5JW_08235, partial [Candidatus Bathyarchaeia archaeon]
ADYPHLIVERGYASKRRGAFFLEERGEKLIKLLEGADKRLVTPETRRYVEQLMAEVESGSKTMEEALKESLETYAGLYERLAEALKA